ncbi:MAG: SWIB/MDM2 domain-containing protein [Victivallales bacterium]|jgi:chromatin remodeling complex protein RSC6
MNPSRSHSAYPEQEGTHCKIYGWYFNKSRGMRVKAATSKFMAPVTPSEKLAAIVGSTPIPRTEITKKLWAYIKKNKLQDSKNKRNINADDKLRPIFKKDQVSMFDTTKLVSKQVVS